MRRILPLLILLAVAAPPPPAAGITSVARTGSVTDIALAGDRAVFNDATNTRRRVRVAPFFGRAITLYSDTFKAGARQIGLQPAVAASPDRLAAVVGEIFLGEGGADPLYHRLLAGSSAGPLSTVHTDEHPAREVPSLDVSGAAIATIEGKDATPMIDGTRIAKDGALDIRVAGPFAAVAYDDGPASRLIVVIDRATATE